MLESRTALEARALAARPVKRLGHHEELANLAVCLVSSQSEYINGDCVTTDDGHWLYGAGEFNDFLGLPESREQFDKKLVCSAISAGFFSSPQGFPTRSPRYRTTAKLSPGRSSEHLRIVASSEERNGGNGF